MRCILCGKLNPSKRKDCIGCGFPLKRPNMNLNTMSKGDLALMWKVSGDQGDKKSQAEIIKIIKRRKL